MTKIILKKSIPMIIAITTTIALLGLSSVFITNQEALAETRERPQIPTKSFDDVSAQQDILLCDLNRFIPPDPLRVNIVPTKKGFHSVIMEKEILDCIFIPEGGAPTPVIVQETLLIQQNEFRNGKTVGTMKIELVTCDKSLEFAEFPPNCINLGTPPTTLDPLDCSGDAETNEAFVDMDSASYDWLHTFAIKKVTTKTIIVEKEIFDCFIVGTETPVIVETYIIEEKINGVIQPFKWVICEKDPSFGIVACLASDTPV